MDIVVGMMLPEVIDETHRAEIDPAELVQMAAAVAISGLGLGLVLNFGQEELEIRRVCPDE